MQVEKATNITEPNGLKQSVIDELAKVLRQRGIPEAVVSSAVFDYKGNDRYRMVSAVNGKVVVGAIHVYPHQPVYAHRFNHLDLMRQLPPRTLSGEWSPLYFLHLSEDFQLEFIIRDEDLTEHFFRFFRDEYTKPDTSAGLTHRLNLSGGEVKMMVWNVDQKLIHITFRVQELAHMVVDFINQNYKPN